MINNFFYCKRQSTMPSKRQNRIQKKLNSSKRTGTIPRKKKKINEKSNKLSRKENTTKIKLLDISLGLSEEHDSIKEKIEDNVTDSLLLEMNENNIRMQYIGVKNFAMFLNKKNLPPEISQYILSICMKNFHFERNIFNLLPRDMIHIFHKRGLMEIKNEEIESVMRNYSDKKYTYNFLYNVLKNRRRKLFRYWNANDYDHFHNFIYMNNL